MVEIYNYDVTTHERFARDVEAVEAFKKQYHIPATGERGIAIQSYVLDFVPKPAAIIQLLQLDQKKTWARFTLPKNFAQQRYFTSYVAPSLGPLEKQDADIQKLTSYINLRRKKFQERGERDQRDGQEEKEEDEESAILINLLSKGVKETNQMVDFVTSRMKQFIQA